ncbi:MAG: phosphoribosylaminoimidazolecarboxamide formyltransferase [Verrucomicrobia bacterium]|nr:phosphoribosylaminoimidazolecarboxamide formyltransferase [Verrucomicrobiota bacterium]
MSRDELALRYGCNPHQTPAHVRMNDGRLPFRVVHGQPGYINLLDALNSWQLVKELSAAVCLPAAASFKHVSPAGAAVGLPLREELAQAYFVEDLDLSPLACAYARARGADRMSSLGDWIALSDRVDLSCAQLIRREVSHGIIAPGFDEAAIPILSSKLGGSYVLIEIDPSYEPGAMETREVFGITFQQCRNDRPIAVNLLSDVVTQNRELPDTAKRDMLVALVALKYTQSNSVCFAVEGQIIGMGAGQQSRIHCTRLAGEKADKWWLRQHPAVRALLFEEGLRRPERDNAIDLFLTEGITPTEQTILDAAFRQQPERLTADQRSQWLDRLSGVVLGSDAYIPFRDNIDRAVRSGARYIVQPGGSLRDEDVIGACNEYGIAMVFSGLRLFHH